MWTNNPLKADNKIKKRDLCVKQPDSGYRHSIDPILLSEFAQVKEGDRVVDLGCGVGIILLRLARTVDSAEMLGIEIQPAMATLANDNVSANGLQDSIHILNLDIRELSAHVTVDSFNVVVTNPPYRPTGTGRVAPNSARAMARHEVSGGLVDFLKTASALLKTGGRFYIVYLAERLAELLAEMRRYRIEPKRLRMVHSREGEDARLVLVEGRKNGNPGLKVEAPLFVYAGPGRSYSAETLQIYGVEQVPSLDEEQEEPSGM